jgi:tRNA A-37 threonylcarbamoyl transferase component Bud32
VSHPLIGQTLGHYRLTGALGAGAMSEVYLATDTRLQKDVAVKVILEKIAQRPDLLERFEREARAAARLDHPNVAAVYFSGTHEGRPFYAMELIRGHSLEVLCEQHPRCTPDQLLSLFAQCCAGLQVALDAGVLHRDIKPANLMLTKDGVVKVVDFGLARLADEKGMTRSGTVIGTPFYMAPEVVSGKPADHRADIYSLGVTFFHLLAGAPPYDAETPYGVMMQHIQAPIPALRRAAPWVPQELESVVHGMMAKDPSLRPGSYADVHTRLRTAAARAGRAMLDQHLGWCGTERTFTRAESGGRCGSCHRVYGVGERPERYHVDVKGWRENDGRERVVSWLSRAVNQSEADVLTLVSTLPYRVAGRVQRERARKIQRQLHDLGADVELAPVPLGEGEGGALRSLEWRPHWPPPPKGGGVVELPAAASSKSAPSPSNGPAGPTLGWVLSTILGVVVIVLVGVLVARRPQPSPPALSASTGGRDVGPPPSPSPSVGPAKVLEEPRGQERWEEVVAEAEAAGRREAEDVTQPATAPPVVARVPEDAPVDEPPVAAATLRSTWFQVDVADGLAEEDARAALLALESGAEAVEATLGGLRRRPLPVRLTGSDVADTRNWERALLSSTLEAPAQGAAEGGSTLRAAAARTVAMATLRRRGGPSTPAWLLQGCGDLVSGASSEDEVRRERPPTRLPSGTRGTAAAWASFCRFLVDGHGWSTVGAFADHLGSSRSLDDAAQRSWGVTISELEQEWMAAGSGE